MKYALGLLLLFCTAAMAFGADAEFSTKKFERGYFTKNGLFEQARKTKGKLLELQLEHTLKLTTRSFERPNACHAEASISYMQMGDRIRVDTKIVNEDCDASNGNYTLRIRTKDEEGEQHMRKFTESWARVNDAPIELTQFYDMGTDVDLHWITIETSTETACICNDPVSGDDSGDIESQ